MRAAQRVAMVLGLAALVGLLARVRGKEAPPETSGGWRMLEGPSFR